MCRIPHWSGAACGDPRRGFDSGKVSSRGGVQIRPAPRQARRLPDQVLRHARPAVGLLTVSGARLLADVLGVPYPHFEGRGGDAYGAEP